MSYVDFSGSKITSFLYSVLLHRWTIANFILPVQQIALQSPSSLRDSVLLPKMHDAVLFRPKNSTAIQLLLPFPLKCRFRFADETHNEKNNNKNRWESLNMDLKMDLRVFSLYQKRLFHQNMEIMVHIKYADKRNATHNVTFKEAHFYVFRHGNFRIIFK